MDMVHCKFLGKYMLFVVIFIIVLLYSPRIRKYHPRKECPIICPSLEADGFLGGGGVRKSRIFFLKN